MQSANLIKGFVIFLAFLGSCPLESYAQDAVRSAQERLQKLGYDPGALDGMSGKVTRRAIEKFQSDRKLPVSGELDPETSEHLFADLILYTQNFDPFHYRNPVTGQLDGPAVVLIKKTCQDADLRCVLKIGEGSWGDTQEQVRSGNGDGLFLIGWDASRADYLLRTDEILSTEYGFFVRTDDPLSYVEPEILDGYTVGVYGPSNTSHTLEKIILGLRDKGVRVDEDLDKDGDAVFLKLSASKGKFAAFSNKDVGNSIVRRLGLGNIRYAGRQQCLSYYLGISNRYKDSDFVKRFDEAFRHIDENGLKRVILAPYGISANDGACGIPVPSSSIAAAEGPTPRTTASAAPDCVAKVDGKDDVVVCSKSCLTWQKSGSGRPLTWHEASGSFIEELNAKRFGTAADWRLPSSEELRSLLTKDIVRENRMYLVSGFDAKQTECWTADRKTEGGRDEAYYVDFFNGALDSKSASDTNYVRAVRGGCNP